MSEYISRGRKARRCYGFDEIALVPGDITINPNDVDVSWTLADKRIEIPIIAAAMDGVVDTNFAIEMGKLGGLAVLNLDGVQTRYENPDEIINEIVNCNYEDATKKIQEAYRTPVKENLIAKRVSEIKAAGVTAIVSSIPQNADRFGQIAQDAGVDLFVVQSTVTTVRHLSTEYKTLDFEKFCKEMKVPVIVGNTVSYNASVELMETGIAALLVGIGPGAACTTRGVLGIGMPQVTATADCAAARDFWFKKSGKYVPIITDGGMSNGGDICKAIASGADAVMIGSAFARAKEGPGKGYHWGMATSNENLPRGTRIKVGITGSIKQILLGPAELDDGSQNLIGALRTSMGSIGAKDIRDMQLTRIIIAPSIQTEGKVFQAAQKVGMAKK
jgi:IMP dehydrogenase